MKKLLYISATLLLSSLVMWACKDKEESAEFTLVSADTTYPATGGSGSIVTEGIAIRNAESSEGWCTLTAGADRIDITVAPNPNISERTARITLTPQSGVALNVYVIQSGSLFIIDPDGNSILTYEDGVYSGFSPLAGAEFQLGIYSDMNYRVEIETPGLSYSSDNGTLYFTVGASGRPRILEAEVSVTYADGALNSKTVRFNQGPTYEELLGTWNMIYYDNSLYDPQRSVIEVTFAEAVAGESYTLSRIPIWVSNNIYGIPTLLYEPADGSISIQNAQYLGSLIDSNGNTNYIFLCMMHAYLSTPTSTAYTYTFWNQDYYYVKFDFDMDYDGLRLVMGDNGAIIGTPPNGLVTYGFATNPPDGYNYIFWWTQFFFFELVKI